MSKRQTNIYFFILLPQDKAIFLFYSVDYIFDYIFLLDHWVHCGIFENGVLLTYTLESVSSVSNLITAYEESQ